VAFTNFFLGPTYFAIYLTFSILALSHYDIFATRLKYILIGWFAVVIVLLSSRMGILLLMGVSSVHLLYQLFKRNFSLKESLTATGFVVALCLLILISPVARFRVLEEPLSTPLEIPSSPENWNSVNLRLLEWGSSLEGIKKYGVKGTGTGGTLDVLHAYYEQAPRGGMDMKYNAHNQYLETYLEIGLAGFVTLLACLFIPMQHAVKTNNKLLLFLILIVGAGCLTTCMFEKARGLMFYVAFVSLFMFTQNKDDSQVER
jgi:O-antigen ligase